jgi:hypothetical protein
MSQKIPSSGKFRWDKRRLEAAHHVADGILSLDEIATRCGVNRRTLWSWKENPEFAAKVAELLEDIARQVYRCTITHKLERICRLQEWWDGCQAVKQERSQNPETIAMPGGSTGLIAREPKQCGTQTVYVGKFDAALVQQMRELAKQAAQEMGQWAEKHELSGPGGEPIRMVEIVRPAKEKADDA